MNDWLKFLAYSDNSQIVYIYNEKLIDVST